MYNLFITLIIFTIGANGATYTIQNQDNLFLCLKRGKNSIQLSTSDDSTCSPIVFSIHAHEGELVLNFKDVTTCKFMCINQCGQLYYDEMFHTKDCVFTTMAFEAFDQLSVNRFNHSDFVATIGYDIIPFSLRRGAYQERLEKLLKLNIKENSTGTACGIGNVNTNTKITKECTDTHKCETRRFNHHAGYKNFNWWERFLIMVGWVKISAPPSGIRLLEYNLNY